MFDNWPGVINDLVDKTYADDESLAVHLDILSDLLEAGISKGRSRKKCVTGHPIRVVENRRPSRNSFSKRTKWEGWMSKFNKVWSYISNTMDWDVNTPERITRVISGVAQPKYLIEFCGQQLSISGWKRMGVFSHAITFRNTIIIPPI